MFKRFGLLTAGFVAPLVLAGGVANAQIPVQIIHNSPDPAASTLDVYVDGTRVLDDMNWKEASPFVDEFGTPQIIVAPTSTVDVVDGSDPDNSTPIYSEDLLLTMGQPALLQIVGMVPPSSIVNPEGINTDMDLVVFEGYRPLAAVPSTAEMMAVAGAPDMGAVDLLIRTGAPGEGTILFADLSYKDTQDYVVLQPEDVLLDAVEAGTNNVIKTWDASFGLVVGAGVVGSAGGFRNPVESLSLFGAVASGFVFELSTPVAVGDPGGAMNFLLGRAYPNPFHPQATIPFELSTGQTVTLRAFDMQGRLVVTLVDELLPAGNYNIPFAAQGLASGTYVYELRSNEGVQRKTMTLIK